MARLQRFYICVFAVLLCVGQQSSFLCAPESVSGSMLAPRMSSSFSAVRTKALLANLFGLYLEHYPLLEQLSNKLPAHKHQRLEKALLKHAQSKDTGISRAEWAHLVHKREVWREFYKLLMTIKLPEHDVADIGRIVVLLDDMFAGDEDFAGVIEHTVQVAYMSGDFLNTAGQLSNILYTDLSGDAGLSKSLEEIFNVSLSMTYINMPQVILNYLYYYYRDYVDHVRETIIPDILRAALLHDLGKFFIPPDVLNFPSKHSNGQRHIMQMHSLFSFILCRAAGYSEEISNLVLHHHEHPSGDGYPDGLIGRSITWQMRLLSAVDVFSALDETRPYKEGLPVHTCLAIMQEMAASGILDKDVVSLFENNLNGKLFESCA